MTASKQFIKDSVGRFLEPVSDDDNDWPPPWPD